MEAVRSFETSVDFYIPEDSTLHYHGCHNLKSQIPAFVGETGESHEMHQSGYPISGPGIKPGTF
jgi:hypothetical protein